MWGDSQWLHGQKLINLGQKMINDADDHLAHTDFVGAAPAHLIKEAEKGLNIRNRGFKMQEAAEKKGGVNLYYEVCIKHNPFFSFPE